MVATASALTRRCVSCGAKESLSGAKMLPGFGPVRDGGH